MTISVPTSLALVSTSVVDQTPLYDRNTRAYYQAGQKMQDIDSIFSFSGASFIPDIYDVANEQTYTVDKVLFKDSTTVKVTSIGSLSVLKQPEEYTAIADTTFTFNTWTKYFSKIQTAIPAGTYNGFTKVVDGVTHQLYRDATSSTGWRYKITWKYWGTELYSQVVPYSFVGWKFLDNTYLRISFKSQTAGDKLTLSGLYPEPTPYSSIWTGVDGNRYRCGSLRFSNTEYKEYGVQLEETATYSTEANFYTSLDSNSVISNAYCADTSDCADRWLGRTFVQRGTDLYVRTNSGTLETKTVNAPQYAVIYNLSEFPNFSLSGANLNYAPIDAKNYTYATAVGTMSYTIKGTNRFNTLALGRVKADSANIVFKNSLGETINTIVIALDGSRDTLGNLDKWYTTEIFYSTSVLEADSTVEITLTGTNIELGNIMLGISVDAGMTLLSMRHSFKDYSVLDTDVFGNQTYIERARVNRFSGAVDIETKDYDRSVRLLSSLGQNLVIVNGSDAKNTPANGVSVFASTKMIGRFESFDQKVETKDGDIDEISTYNYTFTEIV